MKLVRERRMGRPDVAEYRHGKRLRKRLRLPLRIRLQPRQLRRLNWEAPMR